MNQEAPTHQIRSCYSAVKERIFQACRAQGRAATAVRLLAVSKKQPIAKIKELFNAGQQEFAENYANELIAKAQELKELPISWVFIGRLQSNKIKRIVEVADEIQSAASLRHVEYIARFANELGKAPYPIYLQVNAGSEESKDGVELSEALPLAEHIRTKFPALALQGLMAIPPRFTGEGVLSEQAELYRQLRTLASQIGAGKLSLGMSEDLEAAIAAGSDCVRIGTALFGSRL